MQSSGSSAEPIADLGPRYRCLRELGRGAKGRVFHVEDTFLGVELALKWLHVTPAPDELRRFQREFALLTRIEHPRIARAHDFGFLEGRPFFTADLIDGRPLGSRHEISNAGQVLDLLSAIGEPLAFLHERDVLHLDVKPSNVMVKERDGRLEPILIDFGLCRQGVSADSSLRIEGSLPFMGPEYFRDDAGGLPHRGLRVAGASAIGPWTDVYALGMTFYWLISGCWARQAQRDWDPAPPAPRSQRFEVSQDLSSVILKCISLDPGRRFRSANELLHALSRLRGERAPVASAGTSSLADTVGRSSELREIDRLVTHVVDHNRDPGVLLVTGAPGMGQSHLLREVKVRAQVAGIACFLEVGYPGQTSAPGSLLRPLDALLRTSRGDVSAPVERWTAFLDRLRLPRPGDRSEASDAERKSRRAAEVELALKELVEPAVIVIDGLQHWDEVSIELLSNLVHAVGGSTEPGTSPLGLVLGYREEGPSAPILRDLSTWLLEQNRARVIALAPLGPKDSAELFRQLGGQPSERRRGLGFTQETGGSPARIAALARAHRAQPVRLDSGNPAFDSKPLRGLRRQLALTLAVLRHPASLEELGKLTGRRRLEIQSALHGIDDSSLVHELRDESGNMQWLAGPSAEDLIDESDSVAKRAHARIARALLSRSASPSDPRFLEAVRHFQAAGDQRSLRRHGLPAARYLAATFQSRSALALLEDVLESLPVKDSSARLGVALDMAALHARVGDLDEGIQKLEEVLLGSARLPRRVRKRALLQLAVLHSRKGDFKRADALFSEGLGGGVTRDLLHFRTEQAAMKAFLGHREEALGLCDAGLRLARKRRDRQGREAALNFHAVQANVALRVFDFDAALESLEKALGIAVAIGSLGNQAVILNNLAKVLSQRDRYPEAICAFGEAERICLRIDEGPSLAAIHGNVAVLHAKVGEFAAMESAWEKADRLAPAAVGPRERFFLAHARGLSFLFHGRFHEARQHLEEAIKIGKPLGDQHVVVFDEVYRAECWIFEGSVGEAAKELQRISGSTSSPAVRRMALARLALARAFLKESESAVQAVLQHDRCTGAPVIQFLDAWDGLLLAWALSLCGRADDSITLLESSMAFFLSHGLQPLAELGRLVQVERSISLGDRKAAQALLDASSLQGNRYAAAWKPMLQAQLLALEGLDDEHRERCAGCLDEAGGALVGNPIPALSARLEAFRGTLVSKARAGNIDAARASTDTAPITGAWTAQSTRLVARSQRMARLVQQLRQIRKGDLPVLIQGETGSGKELIARKIHAQSPRASGPFVVVDCAAIPQGMLEAELFGARKGSYTGITEDRDGILRTAERGTVLVDETSSLPLETQAKLLRVLSERKVRALGAESAKLLDVRFIFSTSRDLEAEVQAGRFRRDLFHRICVLRLELPPLRERQEDLKELIAAFLSPHGKGHWLLDDSVLSRMRRHSWPGNVRELKNLISRFLLEGSVPPSADEIDRALSGSGASPGFPGNLLAEEDLSALKRRLEREYVLFHFRRLGGDLPALSALLGLRRRQLYYRLKRLGLKLREEKGRLP